jgi:hypothetical protein
LKCRLIPLQAPDVVTLSLRSLDRCPVPFVVAAWFGGAEVTMHGSVVVVVVDVVVVVEVDVVVVEAVVGVVIAWGRPTITSSALWVIEFEPNLGPMNEYEGLLVVTVTLSSSTPTMALDEHGIADDVPAW